MGQAASSLGCQPTIVPDGPPPLMVGLGLRLEPTFVGFMSRITCYCQFACLECMTVVPGAVFWINPPIVTYSPKLMELISLNPYTYVW